MLLRHLPGQETEARGARQEPLRGPRCDQLRARTNLVRRHRSLCSVHHERRPRWGLLHDHGERRILLDEHGLRLVPNRRRLSALLRTSGGLHPVCRLRPDRGHRLLWDRRMRLPALDVDRRRQKRQTRNGPTPAPGPSARPITTRAPLRASFQRSSGAWSVATQPAWSTVREQEPRSWQSQTMSAGGDCAHGILQGGAFSPRRLPLVIAPRLLPSLLWGGQGLTHTLVPAGSGLMSGGEQHQLTSTQAWPGAQVALFGQGLSGNATCQRDADCVAMGLPSESACAPVSQGLCAGTCPGGMACLIPCGSGSPPP